MSPLNKMKSLSQAGGTTGRFIKALAKLTFGWGHRKSSLQRGVSLHLSRQVPVSGWTQKGLPGQPSSWPPTAGTPGWTDGDTQGKRRWEENCHPGWSREAAGSPQGRGLALPLACCKPGPQVPHLKHEGLALDAFSWGSLRDQGTRQSASRTLLPRS